MSVYEISPLAPLFPMPISLRFQLAGAGSPTSKPIEEPATGAVVPITRQKPIEIGTTG